MTENKRFTFDIDNENGYDEEPYFCNGMDSFYVDNADEMELFIEELNELVEENEQSKMMIATLRNIVLENEDLEQENKELQVQCNLLREQSNEFHRGARENANRVGQLEKENKELKKENVQLKQRIDNICREINDRPTITTTEVMVKLQELIF